MIEWWFVVAVSAALLKTGYSVLQKRLTFEYDGFELSYLTSVAGAVFMTLIGAWYLYYADVSVTPPVAVAIVLSGVANIGAIVAFLTALAFEDLSVVTPLMQSTPIIVAPTEPVVLAAHYDRGVVLGAVAAVVGGYTLLNDTGSLVAPVGRLTNASAMLAFASALLFAGTSLANRFVTTRIPPLLYAFGIYWFVAVGLVLVRSARGQHLPAGGLFRGRLVLLGGVTAFGTSVTYVAFSLASPRGCPSCCSSRASSTSSREGPSSPSGTSSGSCSARSVSSPA